MKILECTMIMICVMLIGGCSASFHDLGIPPQFTPPGKSIITEQLIQPMVYKAPRVDERYTMTNSSLWDLKEGIYFRDTRAYDVGDILTVSIVMNESAKFNNKSESETSVTGSLDGSGTYTFPNGLSPSASANGKLKAGGVIERGGTVNRAEKIRLSVAAVVVEASPNGNLHIHGTQEVRVNHELRVLTVQGVVRASDIQPDNTIPYDKIAEARISYGGANTRHRKTFFGKPFHRSQTIAVASQDLQ